MQSWNNKKLLFSSGKDPLNVKCGDGRIVHIGTMADKENKLFVVGCFDSLLDAFAGQIDRGNFLKTHAEGSPFRILHMVGDGDHCFPGDRGQEDVAVFDFSNTASGKDVFTGKHGVVEQILNAVGVVGNKVTLDHDEPFCVVCEGASAARQVAAGLLRKGK